MTQQDLPMAPGPTSETPERVIFLEGLAQYLSAAHEVCCEFVTKGYGQDLLMGHMLAELSMVISTTRTLRGVVEKEE